MISSQRFLFSLTLVASFLAGIIWIVYSSKQLEAVRNSNNELINNIEAVRNSNNELINNIEAVRNSNNELINNIKELIDLEGVRLGSCAPSSDRWFNHDFDLSVAGYERKVSTLSIKKRLSAEVATVEPESFELIFDRQALKSQYHLIDDVTIVNGEESVSVTYSPSSRDVIALDFLLIGYKAMTAVCSQKITFHFAPSTPAGDWQAKLVIGRGGIKSGALSLPYGTEFHDGLYWTTDCSNEKIVVFDLESQLIKEIRSDSMLTPADIKIHKGKIYVVDETQHNVKVFGMDGVLLKTFGESSSLPFEVRIKDSSLEPGKLNLPLGIAVTDDLIVIVDYGNNRVQGFDHDWNLVWLSGNLDGDKILWDFPYYVEYLPERDLFAVTNRGADEIVLLDKMGRKVVNFGNEVLDYPHELAVTEEGDILVANYSRHNVVRFKASDDYKSTEIVDFDEGFGLAKTVTSIDKDHFVVGFINDSGNAYQVLMSRTSSVKAQVNVYQPEELPMSSATLNTVPAFASTDQQTIMTYMAECAHCHESGQFNAPIRRNLEHWQKYVRVSSTRLVAMMQSAEHRQFKAGTCEACSAETLVSLTNFLRPKMQLAYEFGQSRSHD
ncbi:NHL repeat-containing protein [Alphaproteobacteria bacterium]|nr:NHL repeat-containing protein [Alphaproteobacteria bacterium]